MALNSLNAIHIIYIYIYIICIANPYVGMARFKVVATINVLAFSRQHHRRRINASLHLKIHRAAYRVCPSLQ